MRAGAVGLCRNESDGPNSRSPSPSEGLYFIPESTMISPRTAAGEPQPPTLTLTAAFEGIEGSYSHAVLNAYAARRVRVQDRVRVRALDPVEGGGQGEGRRPRLAGRGSGADHRACLLYTSDAADDLL